MTDFVNQKVDAFGWVLHRKVLERGQTYTAVVPEDMLPSESENITLWTRGQLRGVREDGYVPPPRNPGDFSLERQMMPKGSYSFTALEPTEWWCFNWRANRHALPAVKPLRIEPGQHHRLNAGQLVFLCHGEIDTHAGRLDPGTEVRVSADCIVQAWRESPVYGFIIEEERP